MNTKLNTAAAVAVLIAIAAPSMAFAQRTQVTESPWVYDPARGDPGWGNGPYWQGEPADRLPIWRHNHYRGNDPDNRVRQQLMRDR
jgi:hypothetical protein